MPEEFARPLVPTGRRRGLAWDGHPRLSPGTFATPVLTQLLFGRVRFEADEEYLALRFRFLACVLIAGSLATWLFVLGDQSGRNPMDPRHLRSMQLYAGASLVLWALLRGHKERYRWIAWLYLPMSLAEFGSSVLYANADELRVLWCFVNVPAVYLLLGRAVGGIVVLGTLLALVLGNDALQRPYSAAALMTASVGLLYLGAFFHVYSSQSVSYFKRMRHFNEVLRAQAATDALTGVMNARAYHDAVQRWVLGAERRHAPCCVLFVDLDHFKAINDRHGHAAGDAVLRTVAQSLQAQLRRSDLLGRIGGEEFAVFLPDTALSDGARLADKLRAGVEALRIATDAGELRVTASIGVAGGPARHQDVESLQARADAAMYEAKAAGRNRVTLLDAT